VESGNIKKLQNNPLPLYIMMDSMRSWVGGAIFIVFFGTAAITNISAFQITTTSTSSYRKKAVPVDFTPGVPSCLSKRGKVITALRDAAESADGDSRVNDVTSFLKSDYPAFFSLLVRQNKEIVSSLRASSEGYTFFAPSNAVFEALGEKKLQQLKDDRNSESIEKMAGYHFVPTEALTDAQLRTEDWTVPKSALVDGVPRPLNIGGILTLSGELRVGRSKSGGFLGFGAKEDGGIVVGTEAKITKSHNVGNCIVHEVDKMVSPELLWRYFDQLRLPGF